LSNVAAHYEGAEAPASFTGVEAEWNALDSGAALVDSRWRRWFCATGDERLEFVHGQTTANVEALGAGQGCAAAALTAQGRPLAIFALYEDGERLWIATTAAQTVATRTALSRYLVADDCDFEEDVAARTLAVAGPRAAEILAAAGVADAGALSSWQQRAAWIAGQSVLVASRGDLRVPSFDLLVADAAGNAGDAAAVWAALESAGAVHCGTAALEALRIESGTARYGVDVDESRIAMEARLEWAIHFAKGCYVGQEVVERAVSRGRINHELALLSVAGEVSHGAQVDGGAERDIVTSFAVSPRLGPIALAYLPRALTVEGAELLLRQDAAEIPAKVLPWPRARVLAGRS
jgi:folate-binding protein YgfZ